MSNEKRTHIGDEPIQYFEKRGSSAGLATGAGGIDVIAWYRVPQGVLKGQMVKAYCGSFDTEEEAEAMYGEMNWYSKWTCPSQSLDHLPGEDDPVAGGMYPDDWS